MARDDLHFRLRIPEGLKAQIEEAATANHRSMTAEIVARLETTFADRQGLPADQVELRSLISTVVKEVLDSLGTDQQAKR